LKELFLKPDDEDQFTISFIVRALNLLPDHLFIHEFGGGPTLYSVAALAAKAREIHYSDAQRNPPIILDNMQYDLVTAHHCTDVAATSVDEWIKVIKNITNIVRPGGWLMLSVTTGARTYEVGDVIFECVNLTKEEMNNGLLGTGYRKESIILESYEVEHPHEYSGIILALARRH
jgi:hypothetical protein